MRAFSLLADVVCCRSFTCVHIIKYRMNGDDNDAKYTKISERKRERNVKMEMEANIECHQLKIF